MSLTYKQAIGHDGRFVDVTVKISLVLYSDHPKVEITVRDKSGEYLDPQTVLSHDRLEIINYCAKSHSLFLAAFTQSELNISKWKRELKAK